MSHGHTAPQDLETFQRWAIAVDDQLREAVDAVVALEDPEAERLSDHDVTLSSDRPSCDLAAEVVAEAQTFKESPDRPAWFTPALQMVSVVSIWAHSLMDYFDEVTEQGSAVPDFRTRVLLEEQIIPALDEYQRFFSAVDAAGHLSSITGR